jgi:hypothetical protein
MEEYIKITIPEAEVVRAAAEDMDAFVGVFYDAIMEACGGALTADVMQRLHADQVTLVAYVMMRNEVMDGGFVQLIHNGYGPFIFENPFAKAMRLWGLREFSKFLYSARELYVLHRGDIERDCSDEEFMAMFERYPEFDELDDAFVEMEEEVTEAVAHYVDEHIENFATIV